MSVHQTKIVREVLRAGQPDHEQIAHTIRDQMLVMYDQYLGRPVVFSLVDLYERITGIWSGVDDPTRITLNISPETKADMLARRGDFLSDLKRTEAAFITLITTSWVGRAVIDDPLTFASLGRYQYVAFKLGNFFSSQINVIGDLPPNALRKF